MINVKLNGAEIGFDHPEAGTIADVVGTVAQGLDTDLRIIKVRFNGEDITGKPERHLQAINGDGRFELETARAHDLARETLESIADFHAALNRELTRTAEEFRSGSFEQANEYLLRCIDGLQVLTRTTLSVANLLQAAPAELECGSVRLDKLTEKISEILGEMVQAQENRDGILLADLIEYELQVLLEDWRSGLTSLQQVSLS